MAISLDEVVDFVHHETELAEGGDSLELWRKEVCLVNAESEIPVLAFLI